MLMLLCIHGLLESRYQKTKDLYGCLVKIKVVNETNRTISRSGQKVFEKENAVNTIK